MATGDTFCGIGDGSFRKGERAGSFEDFCVPTNISPLLAEMMNVLEGRNLPHKNTHNFSTRSSCKIAGIFLEVYTVFVKEHTFFCKSTCTFLKVYLKKCIHVTYFGN